MITTYEQLARAIWPEATVDGDGQYAVIAHCCKPPNVQLFVCQDSARRWLQRMDGQPRRRCGARCLARGGHVMYDLDTTNSGT